MKQYGMLRIFLLLIKWRRNLGETLRDLGERELRQVVDGWARARFGIMTIILSLRSIVLGNGNNRIKKISKRY